jgi:hypothetical protein
MTINNYDTYETTAEEYVTAVTELFTVQYTMKLAAWN